MRLRGPLAQPFEPSSITARLHRLHRPFAISSAPPVRRLDQSQKPAFLPPFSLPPPRLDSRFVRLLLLLRLLLLTPQSAVTDRPPSTNLSSLSRLSVCERSRPQTTLPRTTNDLHHYHYHCHYDYYDDKRKLPRAVDSLPPPPRSPTSLHFRTTTLALSQPTRRAPSRRPDYFQSSATWSSSRPSSVATLSSSSPDSSSYRRLDLTRPRLFRAAAHTSPQTSTRSCLRSISRPN